MRVAVAPAPPSPILIPVGVLSAGLLFVARFFPFDSFPIVTCPLRLIAHVPCPSCGMTRAFIRFTHADLAAAFEINPLGGLLAVLAVVLATYALLRHTVLSRGISLVSGPSEVRAAWTTVIVAIGVNWAYLLVTRVAG